MKLLHLTRQLSRGAVHRPQYRVRFGEDVETTWGDELGSLQRAELLSLDEEWLRLTLRGMFYADAVAGLLASRRLLQLFPGGGEAS